MTARRPLIAANWKMNPPPQDFGLAESPYQPHSDIEIVVFPPFLWLHECIDKHLITGAQAGHPDAAGAHTGSISMAMIAAAKATYVLCGHSERRREQHETDADVIAQAKAAIKNGLLPIVCMGETQEERDAKKAKAVIERQMNGLPAGIIIAYEPVWAIGTGKNATPKQAQEMHAFIRSLLSKEEQEQTVILYGGSVTAENAPGLFEQKDIDGALVGGSSLKPNEFRKIIDAMEKRV